MEATLHSHDGHERILSYNGKLLIFQIRQIKGTPNISERTFLNFFKKKFDAVSQKFIEHAKVEYSFSDTKSEITIVLARCVADSRTQLILPCVLLKTCIKNSSAGKCSLLLFHDSDEVECSLKFRMDIDSVQDLQICDGPTVIWRHNDKLVYISQVSPAVITTSFSLFAINWAGTVNGEEIIILGALKTIFSEGTEITNGFNLDHTLQGTEFIVYSIEKQRTISGSCFLPHAYSSVLRCLQVCMMGKEDDKYRTSVLAASSKQLIWLHNGIPKEVCQLPFENPFKLQVASTSQGDLFIISFTSGDVCAIWKDSFKIAANWQQVQVALVDDFIGKGSDQILLLFKNETSHESGVQSFKLTDCCEINYPTEECNITERKSDDDDLQENRLLTIQALESRLQAGLLSLQELQHHLETKHKVLRSSCEALIDIVQGKETAVPCAEKEGLVSLWDDYECNIFPNISEPIIPSPTTECIVESVWQRVVDDFLVIGIKISKSVYSSLSNICLSLILDQTFGAVSPVIKCHTKELRSVIGPYIESRVVFLTEPTAKKQKVSIPEDSLERPSSVPYEDDLRNTVTAVTNLSSLLALNKTSCVLLLHARRENQTDGIDKSEMLILPCGRISLSTEDVLKGIYTVNISEHCQGSLEDIFAVFSLFLKGSFHIFSPDCTLTSVNIWLLGYMQGEPVRQIPEMICSHKPGGLKGTLLIWNPKTPCEGNLTIFHRNPAVLIQCLHSLKRVLPPTAIMNIVQHEGMDNLTDNLAQSVEEELLSLRSALSTAASEVEKDLTLRYKTKMMPSNTMNYEPDTKEHVQKYRDELQTERKQSMLGVHLTANNSLYRQNVLKLAGIQINSDRIAGKLATLSL
ncbi:hypothetical protein GDO86_002866 [Hymenochirus boettgeri]|uniref:Fanconi anemia group B protein n=1 Tax=Hymenochirus boettgeri TaxID=247094 RepID=A0A8T2K3L8_9PIPI|nr:hypothetical protein GDO86_002866 [Hymenochirus boettgeri]